MVNAFELITDIVQVINARPNKAKNSYYKALDSRTGVNGKIPLVRISNHKTHCVTWLGDIRDLGTAMRFPANYYFSIVIENEPSQKDENLPVRVKPFTVHEYTFKQEELEQSDIHAIIQDVIGIFTTGEFANSTGKGKYDPVNAKVTQQTPHTPQKESKTNKNMKKNVVKINENTLRQIVAESVKKVLKESAIRGLDDNGAPTYYATQDDEKIDYAMEQCAKAAMEFVMDKSSQLSEQWFKEFCERCANDGLFNTLDERQIKQCYIKGNEAAHSCVYKGNGVQYGRIPTHYNGEWQD